MIPVLYADERGPYAGDSRFDVWGIQRDARTFDGVGPVIAHPPCGHWGRYWSRCLQPGRDCGPIAVAQVRRAGGILEHPAHSMLFDHSLLPRPGCGVDLWGGYTIAVDQADFGLRCRKPTWLYVCRVPALPALPAAAVGPFKPFESMSAASRKRTPGGLVDWLHLALCGKLAGKVGAA